ncbi:hypothetical protein GCM10027081_37090 [Cupriavidus yeoncheonensis]
MLASVTPYSVTLACAAPDSAPQAADNINSGVFILLVSSLSIYLWMARQAAPHAKRVPGAGARKAARWYVVQGQRAMAP